MEQFSLFSASAPPPPPEPKPQTRTVIANPPRLAKPRPEPDMTGACYLHLEADGAKTRHMRIFDLDQAVKVFEDYRDSYNLGASDLEERCGELTNEHGKLVARISYNGRVWTKDGKPLDGMSGPDWIAYVRGK